VGFFGVGFLGGCTQKTHRVFLGMYPGVRTLLIEHRTQQVDHYTKHHTTHMFNIIYTIHPHRPHLKNNPALKVNELFTDHPHNVLISDNIFRIPRADLPVFFYNF